MVLKPINNKQYFMLVAPNGDPQPMTIGDDMATSYAIVQLMAKAGLSRSAASLIREGFRIVPVTLSINQSGPHDEVANLALSRPKGGIKPGQK